MSRPTRDFAISAAAKSVQGSRCDVNEDYFRLDERRGVFVVADGLGGQCGGKHASRLAAAGLMSEANSLLEQSRSEKGFAEAMAQAFVNVNESILSAAEDLPCFRGMGASAVMAISVFGRLYVVGVGDCRAYLIRDDQADRLTVDQSLFQMLVDAGLAHEKYQKARSRRLLWTCLGDRKFQLPGVRCEEIEPSDRLILVTNGITRVVRDSMIGPLGSASESTSSTAANVVNAALTLNTGDDATCLAVSFDGASCEPL